MLDTTVALALTIHSNPGVFAILMGSGISRSSGIPTGWEIVGHLIRQIAALQGEDCGDDPYRWYTETFNDQPDYARLLNGVAKSPAERSRKLRGYFEPTEQELEEGLKIPTPAHHAIAGLVQRDYVRVIVTPNFDRLMEMALETIGVIPMVLTPDSLAGAMPIRHTGCTIIKVHGDYLEQTIKNTQEELAHYSPAMVEKLNEVFDEYGLIVSGWSAEYDTALCRTIRSRTRAFSTYWATIEEPGQAAQELIRERLAQQITTSGADAFFTELAENITSLEDLSRSRPLTTAMKVATVKRYLVDDRQRIRLYDLIQQQNDEVIGELAKLSPVLYEAGTSDHEILHAYGERFKQYEEIMHPLLALLIAIGFHGRDEHYKLWVNSVTRILHCQKPFGDQNEFSPHLYPVLLSLHAIGISAVAAEQYHALIQISVQTEVTSAGSSRSRKETLRADNIYPPVGLNALWFNNAPQSVPVISHFTEILRQPLLDYLPDESDFYKAVAVFEYLCDLLCLDTLLKDPTLPYRQHYTEKWRLPLLKTEINNNVATTISGQFGIDVEQFSRLQRMLESQLTTMS
ncbi:MAG: hypothetical protein JWL77_5823 [Chthonomonadaceae bacterium]|nr:hypothetical protein [Chthonomonadaceae bacterium]